MPDLPQRRRRFLKTAPALTLALALLLGPFALGTGPGRVSAAPPAQGAFTFTPRVTAIPGTSTPAPTAVGTLGLPPSTTPPATLFPETPGTSETPPPAGGDSTIGYEYPEGSTLWRIWYEGEEIIVDASDPAASALLSAFMITAQGRASAANDLDTANSTMVLSAVGFVTGLLGFLGGALVTASSCAATPLTFYALGGTGWLCVGGVVVTTGGLGTLGVSGVAGFQAWSDHNDAEERLENSTAQAEQYSHILQGLTAP